MTPFSKAPPPASARLFAEPHAPSLIPPSGVHVANIDGASRGNPGPASYAVVVRDPEGRIVLEWAKKIGRETNNVAEYYALLSALDYAATHDITALRVRSDSELLVRQMQGRYKVKSSELKPLFERACRLSRQLKYFAIEHVPREQNRDADALANVALDSGNVSRADPRPSGGPSSDESGAIGQAEPSLPSSRLQAARQSPARLKFRAHVAKGGLVPVEPLDLPEGALVEIELRLASEEQ
jgi:ribonuclease HI